MSYFKIIILLMIITGIGINSDLLLAAEEGDTETTVIKIEGMSCKFCAKMATETMTSTEGVESVKLDLNTGLATVTYNKQSTNPEKIASAVKEETYFDSEVVLAENDKTE